MTVDVTVSLFNFEAGGLSPTGAFDFTGLRQAFLEDPPVDLAVLCEAKFWARRGRQPFLAAVQELDLMHNRPYVGELNTGTLGTAVIYDPTVLRLIRAEEPDFADARNRVRFQLRATGDEFLVYAEQWSHCDAGDRLARAKRLAQFGIDPIPAAIIGDLNESPSGPHFPDLDWTSVPTAIRDYAGRQLPDGTWQRETSALDRLIGAWDPATHSRVDGSGFHHIGELDPHAPRPLPATSNMRTLHIDHALVNDAFRDVATIVPGSYRVHIPRGRTRSEWPSDHRRVSLGLRFGRPDADSQVG